MPSFSLEPGWILSTEHPRAVDDLPVLIHEGKVYRPPDSDGTIESRVATWAYLVLRTQSSANLDEAMAAAKAYLEQWQVSPRILRSQQIEPDQRKATG